MSTTEHGPILLVDDDRGIRETLTEYLEYKGYRVVAAPNGREALEILGQNGRACIILLDLMMPVMDGYGFLEAQRERPHLADIPVVVITAGAEVRDEDLEAAAVLTKPVNLPRLMAAIQQHC